MIKPSFIYSTNNFIRDTINGFSAFDDLLLKSWKDAEDNEAINYRINECKILSKVFYLNSAKFVVKWNEKRFSERRKPLLFKTINQPFDEDNFNFTKIKDNEILLYVAFKNTQDTDGIKNTILVNASPFQEGHSLLVPDLLAQFNQVLRKPALKTAAHVMLLSRQRNFVVGFNSLLAHASVNHLHFHLWINDSELLASTMSLVPLIHDNNDSSRVLVYQLEDHPVQNMVVMFNSDSIDNILDRLWTIVSVLQNHQCPHCLALVRDNSDVTEGGEFGECSLTIRAVVWPRVSYLENGDHDLKFNNATVDANNCDLFVAAVAELTGQVFVGNRTLFDNMTTNSVKESFSRIKISDCQWHNIVQEVAHFVS